MDYADLWLSVGGGVDAARHRVARYVLVRILHVVPTYLPATRYGGPIFAVHGLCKALVARGHEVEVFTTDVDGDGISALPLAHALHRAGVPVPYLAPPLLPPSSPPPP